MRNITLSKREEETIVVLLETQIETLMDLYGNQEELEKEFEWFNFLTMVSLYIQLNGRFETQLLKDSYQLYIQRK